MSNDPYVSSDAVEETRREIRTLVREIAQLARSDVEPEEFFGEFLPKAVSAMAAIGGAVWMLEEGTGLTLKSQVNLQQTRLAEEDAESQARHGRLIQKAFMDASSFLVPPKSDAEGVSPGGQPAGNPTDCLLVLAPLRSDVDTVGVLEVFQRANTGRDAQRGFLRFAVQMCELAADYFRSRELRSLTDRETLWTQLEQFTEAAHSSLDVRQTAFTLVNEGRRLIECDRVSLAVARGRNFRIEAISGQDVFEKRSNTVRLLGKLANMAAGSREPIWYTGETADLAPQIEEVIQEYVDESQSKVLGILPLARPKVDDGRQERDPDKPETPERIIGVLIVERIEDSRLPPKMHQRIEYVCGQGAAALANAWEHENVPLMPLLKAVGKTRWVVSARTLPKTILVAIAVVALVAVMVFWPADFEMEATGTLQPVVRQNIFAGLDGRVEEVLVDHDQAVFSHRILGAEGTPVEGPIFADFLADPEDEFGRQTLLSVRQDAFSFVEGGVQRDDTLRALLPSRGGELEWTDLAISEVVDSQTLRLESGPIAPAVGPVQIEVWRITPLVRLRSTELEMDMTAATGRQATVRQQRDTTRRLLLEQGDLTIEQRNRLSGQLAELEEELQSLEDKLALFRAKQRELLITAPCDGVVMTWDVANRLADRPIRRGQFLMQIADPTRDWQLELQMPEDQIGFVLDHQRTLKPGERLEVRYVLATDPGTPHTGHVNQIHRAAEVRGQEGSTVLMEVELDPDGEAVDRLTADHQAGAELRARVNCGRRSLGYSLFHDLIAFVQSRVLFRL